MNRALRRGALLCLVLVAACGDDPTAPAPHPQAFVEVTAGGAHTCAVSAAGVTYCWGDDGLARLGHSASAPDCADGACTRPVPMRSSLPFASLAAGDAHSCGLVDRQAFCWGFDRHGQLGDAGTVLGNCADDEPFLCSVDPEPVAIGLPLRLVTADWMHGCALALDGRAACWGWNIAGQLGRGRKDLEPHPTPELVQGELRFDHLATGYGHTCGVTPDGEAWCWGSNEQGLLGIGDAEERLSPVRVAGDVTFRRIAAGGQFTCALDDAGQVHCWGWGSEGRLGTGDNSTRYLPGLAMMPEPAVDVRAGRQHTCALGESGTLYCWGENHSGQLGVAGFGFQNRPQPVPLEQPVVEFALGDLHTCAITDDARLYCWGENARGQLGIGTLATPVDSPQPVDP